MRRIVKAIVRQIDIKYWSGVVLAGFIGSLLTLAVTSGRPVAHAQLAPGGPPFAGLRNVEVLWHQTVVGPSQGGDADVNCPTGKIAIGGGGYTNGWINNSLPTGPTITGATDGDTTTPATGWHVNGGNVSAGDTDAAYVICATP